jgi:hypothetical protein
MKKSKNLIMAAALLTAVTTLVAFNIKEKPEATSMRTAVMVTDWERAKAYQTVSQLPAKFFFILLEFDLMSLS